MKSILVKLLLLVVSLIVASPICYMVWQMIWVEGNRLIGATSLHEQFAVGVVASLVAGLQPITFYQGLNDWLEWKRGKIHTQLRQ